MRTIESPQTPPNSVSTIDSKAAVLDAAQRLINQYGYSGFSMRDLAHQSGLAKATLYHHFEDKREIFLQVLERDLTFVHERLLTAASMPGDFPDKLRNVALAFFSLASERGMALFTTLRQAAGMESEFRALMRRYREELHGPVEELFESAIANGSIRPVDTELATLSYFGILQMFASRHVIMNDMELNEQSVDFIVDFTLHGLQLPPSSEPASDSISTPPN